MVTPGIIIEIKNRYSSMNPAMQQISDYLIAHYDEAAYIGIHELAKRSGVSAASVTGYVKELDYKNYKAFQLAMAVSIGQKNVKIQEEKEPFIYGDITEEDNVNDLCQKVFRTSVQMLTDTLSIIDTQSIEKIGKHILKAKRLIFLGVGRSYLTAESGKSRFYRMGINSFCYRDSHEQIVGASMCEKNDVVIAASNYGRSRSVIEATEIAGKRGAITVGITSAKNSPLSKIVQYPLFSASGNENSFDNSTPFEPSSESITQIILLDCLYMYIALQKKESVLKRYYATTKELDVERFN